MINIDNSQVNCNKTTPADIHNVTTPQRLAFIDIAKGITIVTVVWLHLGHSPAQLLNLFFMPLFFFLSGVLFNPGPDFRHLLRRKSKTLLLPLLTGILSGLAIEWLVYDFSDWHEIHHGYYNFTLIANVPLWFIVSLSWLMLIVSLVERISSKASRIAVYVILSIVGYVVSRLEIHNTLFIGNALLSLPFFVIGYKYRDFWKSTRWYSLWLTIVAMALMAIAYVKYVPTNIHWCIYHRLYFPSFIAASSGIYAMLSISLIISRMSECRFLLWLGASTIYILVLHYLLVPPVATLLHSYIPDGTHPVIHSISFLLTAVILSCICAVIGKRLRRMKML